MNFIYSFISKHATLILEERFFEIKLNVFKKILLRIGRRIIIGILT
jgi:hypothetical protein